MGRWFYRYGTNGYRRNGTPRCRDYRHYELLDIENAVHIHLRPSTK
jgi:hypothetical protein